MLVLGIDPGYHKIGFGIIEKKNNNIDLIDFGVIETNNKESFEFRIQEIKKDLDFILHKYKIDFCGIEKLYFTTNTKTGINVAQARGVIISKILDFNIPIYEFTPLEIKNNFTGDGNADKKQIQDMIKKIFHINYDIKPDDTADALAIAYLTSIQHNV